MSSATQLRVLSWNLFHGRALPPVGRSLAGEFERALGGWEWDVALLQEVPPWWAPRLARAAAADWRRAPTSRNLGLPVRRVLAEWRPELLKANGGGSNVILSRTRIVEERRLRLRMLPERRVGQLVTLPGGTVVVNLHCSSRVPLAEDELRRAWGCALQLAQDGPVVLGGDLNLRRPTGVPGAVHAARRDVDHVFAVGLVAEGEGAVLERRASVGGREVELSDHPPLLVTLRPA